MTIIFFFSHTNESVRTAQEASVYGKDTFEKKLLFYRRKNQDFQRF